jgi:hypothetical protein
MRSSHWFIVLVLSFAALIGVDNVTAMGHSDPPPPRDPGNAPMDREQWHFTLKENPGSCDFYSWKDSELPILPIYLPATLPLGTYETEFRENENGNQYISVNGPGGDYIFYEWNYPNYHYWGYIWCINSLNYPGDKFLPKVYNFKVHFFIESGISSIISTNNGYHIADHWESKPGVNIQVLKGDVRYSTPGTYNVVSQEGGGYIRY